MSGGSSAAGMGSGATAVARDASIGDATFSAASGTIKVSRVLAPTDGWLVIRSATPTGGVLGFTQIRKGENRNVTLEFSAVDGRQVRVALFVDRGARGVFEFNPERPAYSLDKPVVVDRAPVEYRVTLSGWGREANPGTVLVMVNDQKASATLDVGYLIVPADSWIEVRRIEKGVPTERVGLLSRPAGEFHQVRVPVQGIRPKDELLVTILADRGVIGRFEPAAGNPLKGVDQPWVSAGTVAAQRVRLE
jgi:hypothetical protein